MNKKTQHEKAYEAILLNIINGTYTPGMSLREVKIANECGLSATPVREAFRRLKMEGWLDSAPYQGCFVKKFTKKELYEFFLLREAMESLAVQEAANNATKEDLLKIKEALDLEEKYISKLKGSDDDRIEHPSETEVQFHRALINASHIGIIKDKLDVLKLQLNSIGHIPGYKYTIREIKDFQKQHYAIYEAICRGWGDAAVALIKGHLSKARENIRKRYDAEENS